MLPEMPARIVALLIYLRGYAAGDGPWDYAMSQRNHAHLAHRDADSVVMSIAGEQEAEAVVREVAAEWRARNAFFMGPFDRQTGEFVAQVCISLVNLDLPEFEIGFFVDEDHEGQGYVTEAVTTALAFTFEHLNAHRVRMECNDTNERSWRVAERCVMIREGHSRENKLNADGTLSGTLYFGLLKSEFEALPWP